MNYYRADFIGKDGSMGLKKGTRYLLWMYPSLIQIIVYDFNEVNKRITTVPYSNIKTFLDNWSEVSKIIL